MERLFNLFLVLWMGMSVSASGQETMDVFIYDLVSTFQLTSPTILFDNDDEIPEICYDSQWVLCLSSNQHERDLKVLSDYRESNRESEGIGVHMKCSFFIQ